MPIHCRYTSGYPLLQTSPPFNISQIPNLLYERARHASPLPGANSFSIYDSYSVWICGAGVLVLVSNLRFDLGVC